MEKTYELDETGELVFKEEIDQAELIQSNRVDTLAEMYNKYMSGELQIPQNKENGEVIDFTETFGKDKLQQVMETNKQFNDILIKYNLPAETTPQQLSDYIALQQHQLDVQTQTTTQGENNNETN